MSDARACERCGQFVSGRRYRCVICSRLVCATCCERIDRTQGQRSVWCRKRDALRQRMPDDCKAQRPSEPAGRGRELDPKHERGHSPREEEGHG